MFKFFLLMAVVSIFSCGSNTDHIMCCLMSHNIMAIALKMNLWLESFLTTVNQKKKFT